MDQPLGCVCEDGALGSLLPAHPLCPKRSWMFHSWAQSTGISTQFTVGKWTEEGALGQESRALSSSPNSITASFETLGRSIPFDWTVIPERRKMNKMGPTSVPAFCLENK